MLTVLHLLSKSLIHLLIHARNNHWLSSTVLCLRDWIQERTEYKNHDQEGTSVVMDKLDVNTFRQLPWLWPDMNGGWLRSEVCGSLSGYLSKEVFVDRLTETRWLKFSSSTSLKNFLWDESTKACNSWWKSTPLHSGHYFVKVHRYSGSDGASLTSSVCRELTWWCWARGLCVQLAQTLFAVSVRTFFISFRYNQGYIDTGKQQMFIDKIITWGIVWNTLDMLR